MLSEDVPLVVSRQLLQNFAQELGRWEPETQKEIAHYALSQIRAVSFEEQVRLERVPIYILISRISTLYLFSSNSLRLDFTFPALLGMM